MEERLKRAQQAQETERIEAPQEGRVINVGYEITHTLEVDRRHPGTDAKLNNPQEGVVSLVDTHFPHGGNHVMIDTLSLGMGSGLDQKLEKYNQATERTDAQSDAFAQKEIAKVFQEARQKLEAHYVEQGTPPNFRRDISVGMIKTEQRADGRQIAHFASMGEGRVMLLRDGKLALLKKTDEKGLRTRSEEGVRVLSFEAEENDRFLLLSSEVGELSKEELERLLKAQNSPKRTEQQIQQRASKEVKRKKGDRASIDVSAIVYDVRTRETNQPNTEAASNEQQVAQESLAHKKEQITTLTKEIGELEAEVHTLERSAGSELEVAQKQLELARLEKKQALHRYQVALAEQQSISQGFPPQLRQGDKVRMSDVRPGMVRQGWEVKQFDGRMQQADGTFNQNFGKYEVQMPGSTHTQWIDRFRLEGGQAIDIRSQAQAQKGAGVMRELKQAINTYAKAGEEIQKREKQVALMEERQVSLLEEEVKGERVEQVTEEVGQEPTETLEEKQKRLRALEVAKIERALTSQEEAERRKLALSFVYEGGRKGVQTRIERSRAQNTSDSDSLAA